MNDFFCVLVITDYLSIYKFITKQLYILPAEKSHRIMNNN